jgi:hypothetical protein
VTCLLICKQGRGIYNMSHGIGKKEWSSVGLLVSQYEAWKRYRPSYDVFFVCK